LEGLTAYVLRRLLSLKTLYVTHAE